MADRFSFEEFSRELPPPAVPVLREEGFNTLPALLSANASDIECLKLKRGHVAQVRETVTRLQETHRKGPLYTAASREPKQHTGPAEARKSASEQLRSFVTSETPATEAEVRAVLIGMTGCGKSALGNTLLGRDAFSSQGGLNSHTQDSQWAEGSIDDTILSVTDTPGLADTERPEGEILREVSKSIILACPGPHVVIFVIRCDRRFTNEEHKAVKTLKNLFGEQVCRFLMVVFTGGDGLQVPRENMQWALQQMLAGAPQTLKDVMRDVGSAYCVVDNTVSFDLRKSYAKEVLCMIQAVRRRNKGGYFTNSQLERYNRIVQSAVDRRERTEHMSHDEAVRATREDIVAGKEEPGFFRSVLNVSRDYILPVVSTATNVVVAGRLLAMAGCEVM